MPHDETGMRWRSPVLADSLKDERAALAELERIVLNDPTAKQAKKGRGK